MYIQKCAHKMVHIKIAIFMFYIFYYNKKFVERTKNKINFFFKKTVTSQPHCFFASFSVNRPRPNGSLSTIQLSPNYQATWYKRGSEGTKKEEICSTLEQKRQEGKKKRRKGKKGEKLREERGLAHNKE